MKTARDLDQDYAASGGDGGATFTFRCPDCQDKIRVAEFGWWDAKCSCGYEWELDAITATGNKIKTKK